MEIDLGGGYQIRSLADAQQRLSMMLWGAAGCGKTTLAASAPGKKLLINFDPDGPASLGARDDVIILDLSNQKHTITEKFKSDDPFSLSKYLQDEELGIDTVLVDSLTSYAQYAVEQGISVTKGATVERPSPGAYGARNALTLRLVSGLLRLTGKLNKHIIFTSHEDAPTTDDNGNVLYITIMLGGKLPDQAALQISEVWFMQDTGKERRLLLRPGRTRKPMKSRMFDTRTKTEFISNYDPDNGWDSKGSINSFYQEWLDNGRNKIQVP
ncbi:MAG TPA: AAA family ATPase [Candidatus Saccharimonadales bacterium]|nr:AAA family ATPase [Candidatus Saccharimonadales bacterium]